MLQLYKLNRELRQVCTSPALPPSQHSQRCMSMTTASLLVFAHELQRPVAGALQKRCADAARSLVQQRRRVGEVHVAPMPIQILLLQASRQQKPCSEGSTMLTMGGNSGVIVFFHWSRVGTILLHGVFLTISLQGWGLGACPRCTRFIACEHRTMPF